MHANICLIYAECCSETCIRQQYLDPGADILMMTLSSVKDVSNDDKLLYVVNPRTNFGLDFLDLPVLIPCTRNLCISFLSCP